MDNFHEIENWEDLPYGSIANLFVESSREANEYARQHPNVQVYWVKSMLMGVRVSPMRRDSDRLYREEK